MIRPQRGEFGEGDDALGPPQCFDTVHPLLHDARRRKPGIRSLAAIFVGCSIADAIFLAQAFARVLFSRFVRRDPSCDDPTLLRMRCKLGPNVSVPPFGGTRSSGDACQASHYVSAVGDQLDGLAHRANGGQRSRHFGALCRLHTIHGTRQVGSRCPAGAIDAQPPRRSRKDWVQRMYTGSV
jgi:hypothetical protein